MYGPVAASPLASVPPTQSSVDPPVAETGERLLVLDEGVWTSRAVQAMLEEQGIQPLRTVRHDALLVWMGDEAVSLDVGVSVGEHETAAREALKRPMAPVVWVCSNRLPADGIVNLRETLALLGFLCSKSTAFREIYPPRSVLCAGR